jgi:hypothetical protein
MLNATFLPMDVHAIMEIPLSLINQEDTWAWSHEKNGVFRVRSAYRMLIHTKKIREDWLDHRPATSNASDEGKMVVFFVVDENSIQDTGVCLEAGP